MSGPRDLFQQADLEEDEQDEGDETDGPQKAPKEDAFKS